VYPSSVNRAQNKKRNKFKGELRLMNKKRLISGLVACAMMIQMAVPAMADTRMETVSDAQVQTMEAKSNTEKDLLEGVIVRNGIASWLKSVHNEEKNNTS